MSDSFLSSSQTVTNCKSCERVFFKMELIDVEQQMFAQVKTFVQVFTEHGSKFANVGNFNPLALNLQQ